MAKRPLPSQSELRQLLDYNPATGLFVWKARGPEYFNDSVAVNGRRLSAQRHSSVWNGKFAGTPALTAQKPKGYLFGSINGMQLHAHRVAWAMTYGQWPDGEIDHINHDKADNRIANLRIVSRAENMRNLSKSSRNTSGVTGVFQRKNREGWFASITASGVTHDLGQYKDIRDAIKARKTAEMRFGFHPNHGAENVSRSSK